MSDNNFPDIDTWMKAKLEDQQNCNHSTLYFGSGDYYVMCKECSRTWVKAGLGSDQADPEYVNNSITGEERHELTLENIVVMVKE